MAVNVLVSAAASIRHRRAKVVRWDVFWRMLPLGLVFIVVGVALSNRIPAGPLQICFGAFLLYSAVVEAIGLARRYEEPVTGEQKTGLMRCGAVATLMGLTGGILGIGGGGIAVPLLRRLCKLPIREAIATSAAVMVLTSIVGALHKNLTLPTHLDADGEPLSIATSLTIAACMAPTGVAGGMIGAVLTHRLPIKAVKMAFIALMLVSSLKMFGAI